MRLALIAPSTLVSFGGNSSGGTGFRQGRGGATGPAPAGSRRTGRKGLTAEDAEGRGPSPIGYGPQGGGGFSFGLNNATTQA